MLKLGITALWLITTLSCAAVESSFQRQILPLLDRYCADCHADGVSKGDFSFDDFRGDIEAADVAEKWHEVINVLNERRMPPEDREHPAAEEALTVVSWVSDELRRAEVRLAGSGKVVLRRLNQREYVASIEDLLGIPPVGAGAFAADGKVEGLDNQGQGLFMSPYQLERYMESALATLAIALPTEEVVPLKLQRNGNELEYEGHAFVYAQTWRHPDQAYLEEKQKWDEMSAERKIGKPEPKPYTGKEWDARAWASEHDPATLSGGENGIIVLNPINNRAQEIIASAKLVVPLEVPATGWYRVRILAGVGPETKWDRSTVTVGWFPYIEGRGGAQNRGHNAAFREEVKGTYDRPAWVEKLVFLEQGKARYYVHKGNLAWETEVYDLPDFYNKMYNERIARHEYWRGLLVEQLEVDGPIAPSQAMELLFPDGLRAPYEPAKAAIALQRLARRAFRRPVALAEVQPYLNAWAVKEGETMDRAAFLKLVQRGAAMILSSPKFLYLVEQSAEAGALNSFELATRLSFFLWGTLPDEELLLCAENQSLLNAEVLWAQAQRMLKDTRSSAMFMALARGWFGLDRLTTITPDRRRFRMATFDMPETLQQQTAAFVEHIFRADLSALDIIDSDWDMLNAKLARYYGLDHLQIQGTEMRQVKLEGEDRLRRGGVLAHASILTMTSNGTRTSPVVRGAWVVEHLLGRPPPPPPPNVAALEEVEADLESMSLKELMQLHTRDPHCAACHKHFDPYGLGLENYDAAGQWQDNLIKFMDAKGNNAYQKVALAPVDASGVLPDGTAFVGAHDLKQILLERRAEFAQHLTRKVLALALGRPAQFADNPLVRELAQTFADKEHRLLPLFKGVILSPEFRRR